MPRMKVINDDAFRETYKVFLPTRKNFRPTKYQREEKMDPRKNIIIINFEHI